APSRSLLKMGRPLQDQDRIPRDLPTGFTWTTFAERPDVEALQRVNADAFASHPEQGRLTVGDLRARREQAWFDPEGLIWVVDNHAAPEADPAAFHWTKIEPTGPDPSGVTGEIYVVGVHPAYQGRGLAGPLTDLGL